MDRVLHYALPESIPVIEWRRCLAWDEVAFELGRRRRPLVVDEGAGGEPGGVIEVVARAFPGTPVLIRTLQACWTEASRLARLGAFAVLPQSEEGSLREAVARAWKVAPVPVEAARNPEWRRHLVGRSAAMERLAATIELVASRRSTVLITGETGTGKEMAARAVHLASPRAEQPLVSINCSALPENLLEAELFGHVRGAFTGAIAPRAGRFESAHRGTIFLDEIGDMPIDLQAKLLRVLQEREFQRLGSSETIKVDVRVIAATNIDLLDRVREGKFREDLFYRLNVVGLALPPLRERPDDIPQLVEHFIGKICRLEGLPPKTVFPETLQRLESYQWPGNVRQLENAVEVAVALSGDRPVLYPADFPLPQAPMPRLGDVTVAVPSIALPDTGLDFERTMNSIELSLLHQALERANGNKTAAADILNLNRTTFTAKLKSLGASSGRG